MVLTIRTLDDFVDILSAVSDSDQLLDAVDAHIRWLGFEKFAYHMVRPPGGPRFPFS
jgi:hypothetical protein